MANNTSATQAVPTGAVLASSGNMYVAFGNPTTIAPTTLTTAGNGQPHENRQPFLSLYWVIALQGIFPSRN
jgi:microcystin-dependent protein